MLLCVFSQTSYPNCPYLLTFTQWYTHLCDSKDFFCCDDVFKGTKTKKPRNSMRYLDNYDRKSIVFAHWWNNGLHRSSSNTKTPLFDIKFIKILTIWLPPIVLTCFVKEETVEFEIWKKSRLHTLILFFCIVLQA